MAFGANHFRCYSRLGKSVWPLGDVTPRTRFVAIADDQSDRTLFFGGSEIALGNLDSLQSHILRTGLMGLFELED